MDLLIPSTGLLFWMTITFLVVLGLLWKFGFPVIIKMVNERKKYIDESLEKAHDANQKLANIKVEGEKLLQDAREKQAQILKGQKKEEKNIQKKTSRICYNSIRRRWSIWLLWEHGQSS